MKKQLLFFVLAVMASIVTNAALPFEKGKKYRIECTQWKQGSIAIGEKHGETTPVYYLMDDETSADVFWYITEKENGKFYLQNAETNEYLTYDGIRDDDKRYIDMLNSPNGDASLWTIENYNSAYSIRNVENTSQIIDIRRPAYLVGTYSNTGTPSQNELFLFYDSSGKLLEEEVPEEIVGLSEYIDTLLINGKRPVYDKYNEQYLHPVSQTFTEQSDYPASIKVHFKKIGSYEFKINNTTVDSEYEFKDFQNGKIYTLSVYKNNILIASSPLTFTFLPIVEVNGTNFNTSFYQPGSIRVNDPNAIGVDTIIQAKYRYRGATASGQAKKAYAIKLTNTLGESIDQSFFGLRSDNNWILDAMAIDAGRMRNRVSTDLWNDYSVKPYFFEKEPQAINGTRGRFVEVILNGEYAGIYCMTEKLDRKQLKLKKFQEGATPEDPSVIRGVLYKSSQWSYSVLMGHYIDKKEYPYVAASMYSNQSETWDSWEMQYPDITDGEPIDWKPLYDAVNVVAAEKNLQTFKSSVSTYFDLPVFLDYYLLIELILATDNHGKNMFLHNYNIQSSPKMSASPWDLDGTWGRRWDGSTGYTQDATQDFITFLWRYEHGEHTLYKRLMEYNVDNWNQKLAERYADLRNSYFKEDSLVARFVNYRNLFLQSGAETREIRRWNGIGAYMNFDNEMSYLKTWIHSRLITLDNAYRYSPTGVTTAKDSKMYLSVTGETGKVIIHTNEACDVMISTPAAVVLKRLKINEGITEVNLIPGIYIINGNKVIVN